MPLSLPKQNERWSVAIAVLIVPSTGHGKHELVTASDPHGYCATELTVFATTVGPPSIDNTPLAGVHRSARAILMLTRQQRDCERRVGFHRMNLSFNAIFQ